jgi:hypothetical protein
MLRATLAFALAVLLPCSIAPATADAARKRTACERLKGSDLAPAKSVKLVRRRNADDGTDLVGCALPRGRVRTIAYSADYYTTTYTYAIVQVAGPFVLVGGAYNSQYAYSDSLRVADVRNGRSYTIASQCFEITGSPCGGEPTTAPTAVITKVGRAVAAIVAWPGGPMAPRAVTIATFDPRGARRDLDSGSEAAVAPASLSLAGTLATWTHDGQPRSADISSPG